MGSDPTHPEPEMFEFIRLLDALLSLVIAGPLVVGVWMRDRAHIKQLKADAMRDSCLVCDAEVEGSTYTCAACGFDSARRTQPATKIACESYGELKQAREVAQRAETLLSDAMALAKRPTMLCREMADSKYGESETELAEALELLRHVKTVPPVTRERLLHYDHPGSLESAIDDLLTELKPTLLA